MTRRRLPREELRTTFHARGIDAVAEFRAVGAVLGRRPHQLVAGLVHHGMSPILGDRFTANAIEQLVAAVKAPRRECDIRELNALWEARR